MVDAVSNRITTVYRSTTVNNNKRKLDQVASSESSSTTSSSRRTEPNGPLPLTPIQFFIRSFPRGKTLVIQAHSTDSEEFIHDKIKSITAIPIEDQWLIYRGKQLWLEQTLEFCDVQDDTTMQLISRMRSTDHPWSLHLIDDLLSLIFDVLKSNYPSPISDAHHIIR
ncbi:hypothetical protein HAX54_031747 [Datura stramonium]|uniref:Ubiquitin-like domain-containing protein n=1 Tax=Datura stramonium TaxID=4076 RepID=A0ABS8SC49_DATST|nr:hypothetical protein [Datura stramonium]